MIIRFPYEHALACHGLVNALCQFDVLKHENSPYTEIRIDPYTGARAVRMSPIFRAGVNVALFQGRYGRY